MRPLVALALVVATVATARTQTIYGITTDATPNLVSFDALNPNAVTTIGPISGLTAGQSLRGLDFRPSNGQLYAMSNAGTTDAAQLYTINLSTGVASAVGSGLSLTGNASDRISLDFNPVADVLRVVTATGQNYRVDANSGALLAQDANISPATQLSDIAYSNNTPGATATTLFAYDFNNNLLVRVGSANGNPNSPNSGLLETVGPSVAAAINASVGFDIGENGVGYVSMDEQLTPTTRTELYTVNFLTGEFTQVGTGEMPVALLDLSIFIAPVPEPGSLLLAGAAGLGAVRLVRRRLTRRAA